MKNLLITLGLFLTLNVGVCAPAFPPYIPPNPGAPGGGPLQPCWPPPCVPIDGGITFLLLGAAGYGAYKTSKHKRK